jgi:hypothetical protein
VVLAPPSEWAATSVDYVETLTEVANMVGQRVHMTTTNAEGVVNTIEGTVGTRGADPSDDIGNPPL